MYYYLKTDQDNKSLYICKRFYRRAKKSRGEKIRIGKKSTQATNT